MIELRPNTAEQNIYLTLEERLFLPTFTHYLMVLKNEMSNTEYCVILAVVTTNERYTKCQISTDEDDKVNGNVLITETGLFYYTVYAQNSSTNLDPANTVGVVEVGVCKVLTEEDYFEAQSLTIPDTIIYYEGN
jgi:hypothetical protein